MLKTGIVGLKNSETYINILQNLDSYSFVGIYDPSFQVDLNVFYTVEKAVLDFAELVNICDLIIFSADDIVFFPLIKDVLSNSTAVFLDSVHKYNYGQQKVLSKLSYEANCLIQVANSQLNSKLFKAYSNNNPHPLVISSEINTDNPDAILKTIRTELTTVFYIVNSGIRKVKVNLVSAFSQLPDVYIINLEFNNGCNYRLLVSSIAMVSKNIKKIIGLNSYSELDFLEATFLHSTNGEQSSLVCEPKEISFKKNIERQLTTIYRDRINNRVFSNSLEYEIEVCKVMEKVTDKQKLNTVII